MKYKEHDIVKCIPEFFSNQVLDGEVARVKRKLLGGYKYLIQCRVEVEIYETELFAVWIDEKRILGLSAGFRFQ